VSSKVTLGVSVAVLATMAAAAIFAPVLAPFPPNEMVHTPFDAPGVGGMLGADGLGRDMLSRILYATRYTFVATLIATTLACMLGVTLAILAGLSKGWVDIVIGRAIDILMSIPQIIFALIILAIAGVSLTTLILTMAVLQSSTYYRVTRPIAGDLAAMEYVEVGRLRGERLHWYLFKEILPNMVPSLLAQFGLGLSSAALFISSLSFLGIGIQPPAADLGGLVRENALALSTGRLTPLIPAFCIALFCLSVNGIVDWLVGRYSDKPDVK
jgi:peptide/nickel transport system permease protein